MFNRMKPIQHLTAALTLALIGTPSAPAADFEDVRPILRNDCSKCHAYGKRQGGFSIESRELLLKGSNNGPVVRPGQTRDSTLLHLLTTQDEDDRMPQKAAPLSKAKIERLTAWVKAGLPWQEGFVFRHPKAALAPREVKLPESTPEARNPIDRILQPYFAQHKIKPPKPVDDRTFLHRAHLDTIGLPPTPAQLEAFLKTPDRPKLIDTLLDDKQAYMAHWISFWNDILRNSYTRQYHGGNRYKLTNWLKAALLENKPYDQFTRELLNPKGDATAFIDGIKWRGTVNSSQVVEMQAAQNVAQVFLGLNLKCASCHDSFVNDWTLDQAYAFASVFANTPMEKHRCDKPTGQKATAKFLYGELGSIDPASPLPQRREQLATLMTLPDNGRFARVIVNRLWRAYFGRALVEPVDEMDEPPWNQDLLDWLASDLAANQFDLKRTLRIIATSQAYQMPSVTPVPDQKPAQYLFQGPLVRRLRAEQFLDAVAQLSEAANPPAKRPASQRYGLRNLDPLQRILGRPKRDQVATTRDDQATTLQALELTNGSLLHKAVQDAGNRWAAKIKEPDALSQAIYHNALLRKPTLDELQVTRTLLGPTPSATTTADLIWALILQPEFQLR